MHAQTNDVHDGFPSAPRRVGFSLTELLVVIGIIILLVGLLLVALGGVRSRAKQADTEAIMRAFAQACETFQLEHRFYPGVIPEQVLDANPGLLTTTEGALLHLTGGYRVLSPTNSSDTEAVTEYDNYDGFERNFAASGWRLKVDLNRIGEGPIINGKPFGPYFTASSRDTGVVAGQWSGGQVTNDAEQLPDLRDSWGQPIIYTRRLRSIGKLVGEDAKTGQFTIAGLGGYLGSDGLGEIGANQQWSAGNPGGSILTIPPSETIRDHLGKLIRHPALPGEARGAFVLMSAGPDGVYISAADGPGTVSDPVTDILSLPDSVLQDYDDILVFGGG